MEKNFKKVLDFLRCNTDDIYTSLMEIAIRSQVSSEPGYFFAHNGNKQI